MPVDLTAEWRAKAAQLRHVAAEEQAATLEWCAADLEEFWRISQTEPLTLQEAADESGYTYSALQQMVAGGRLRNIGSRHKPRVCRRDLPRKPRPPEDSSVGGGPDVASEILARRAAS